MQKAMWVNIHKGIDQLNKQLQAGWRVVKTSSPNVASSPGHSEDQEGPAWFQSDLLVVLERKDGKPQQQQPAEPVASEDSGSSEERTGAM